MCIAVLTIDAGLLAISQCLKCVIFLRRLIAKKVCAASSRTSYRIVPLTNSNKLLHSDTSETEVNINTSVNNDSEKFLKRTATSSKLIIAVYSRLG